MVESVDIPSCYNVLGNFTTDEVGILKLCQNFLVKLLGVFIPKASSSGATSDSPGYIIAEGANHVSGLSWVRDKHLFSWEVGLRGSGDAQRRPSRTELVASGRDRYIY